MSRFNVLDHAAGRDYDAYQFGVVPGASDSGAALADLEARVAADGGGTILLPRGSVALPAASIGLTFANNLVTMVGKGPGISVLTYAGVGTAIKVTAQQLVRLKGFSLTTSTGVDGVVFEHGGATTSFRHRAKDVYVTGFSGRGLAANGTELALFEEIYAYQCGTGIASENASHQGISNEFRRCRAEDNTVTGFDLQHMSASALISCQALNNGTGQSSDIQLRLRGTTRAISIIAADVENFGNSAKGIGIQAAGTEHKIDPGAVVSLEFGVKLAAATECDVSSGTFSSISQKAYFLDSGSSNNRVFVGGETWQDDNGGNTIVTTPVSVTGSKASGAALASLLTGLDGRGFIADNTSA